MGDSRSIAVVGKGGVGKTTLSAFLIRYLMDNGIKPVLAVDADPSACLAGVLGLEFHETIGGIREDTRSAAGGMPEGIPKQQFLALRVQEAITEAVGYDLLTMGRPEGPGCYCFVNNLLRDNLDRLAANYKAVVMDCEAGLEHISRRTSRNVDIMFLVADPTVKAMETLQNVFAIADELDNTIDRYILIMNRVPAGSEERVQDAIRSKLDMDRFEAVCMIGQDSAIFDAELQGHDLLTLDTELQSYKSFAHFLSNLDKQLI